MCGSALQTFLTLACLLACGCQGGSSGSARESSSAPTASATPAADVVRTRTAGPITYTYRASRMTHLVYAVDCLSGLAACSAPQFADAWKKSDWSEDDDKALVAWSALHRRYTGEIVDQERQAQSPLPLPAHARDIGTALRVSCLGARDLDDVAARLSLFLGSAEVAQARTILERFAPRADQQWRAARTAVSMSLAEYVALGERSDLQALLGQIAAFYVIGENGAHQTFDLVLRPPGAGTTSAQQLGELAVVEVVAGETATDRYPVIAHEMFHAWFAAAPIASQTALVDRFVATGDPLVGPAWGLLDEVLATALGNGLVAKLVDPADYARRIPIEEGLYNDPFIDKVAKALLPALEKRIAARGTVFDEAFVGEYLAAVHAAFPDGLPPRTYLRPLFIPVGAASAGTLIEQSSANHIEAYDRLDESAVLVPDRVAWGTAIFTPRRDLDRMSALVPALALAAAKREPATAFVYAFARRPVGTGFLFVADDAAASDRLVKAFLALGAPLVEGVIVR